MYLSLGQCHLDAKPNENLLDLLNYLNNSINLDNLGIIQETRDCCLLV